MDAGLQPEDAYSDNVTSPTVKNEPEVSQSLVGLIGAFDQFKVAVGYGIQESPEFAAVEQFVRELETENAQLRQHAVDAIQVAERLREENSSLVDELTTTKVNDMVEQANELDKVTHEYDVEVMNARVAEAEAVLEEVAELRTRVSELEEENAGLSEVLNEMRQTQQQLNRLQRLEHGDELSATSAPSSSAVEKGLQTPIGGAMMAEGEGQSDSPLNGDQAGTPAPEARYPSPERTPNTAAKDPVAVAEALSLVAGGAEGGVAATAARMLRDYATLQSALDEERAAKQSLQEEVDRLVEITSSKTFKAPSAWAEREVKYRQEKERWEESRKEADVKLAKMREELDGLRGGSGAAALEKRIEELEARLLESERDRSTVRAALHEMEIQSRASVGEFSLTGVKPYRGPRLGEDGEVQQVVASIESSGGATPTKHSPSLGTVGESTPGPFIGQSAHFGDVNDELAAVKRENERLKAELEKLGINAAAGAAIETPQVVRQALSTSAMKKAKDLEDKLATTQNERAQLLAELESLKQAAAAQGTEEAQRVTLLLRIAETETRTEMALLQRGVDSESARSLASLAAQLRDAQHREHLAMSKLEEMKTAAATAAFLPASDANSSANLDPEAQQQVQQVLEKEVQSVQEEREKLQAQIKEAGEAATVNAELKDTPAVAAGDEAAESLPEEVAGVLEDAIAAATTTAAVDEENEGTAPAGDESNLSNEAMDRIQSLQMQLKAAEQALAALEKGVVPVQMHISVAEAQEAPPPVEMRIAVTEGPTETQVKLPITLASGEEAVASILMPINVAEGSAQPQSVEPIKFSINVAEETHVQVPITVTEAPGAQPIDIAASGDQQRATPTAGSPVKFSINVTEEHQNAPLTMPINISGGQDESMSRVQVPIAVTGGAEAPVSVPITIATDPQKEYRMKQLEAMLKAANEEEERLRRDLEALMPVKLNFTIGGDAAPKSVHPSTGMSRRSSHGSMNEYTPEGLAQDRAAVEAAWQDHVNSSDVPSLMRAKAELETQCQMLQAQLEKMQGQLAEADMEKVQIQESIDDAVRTGDVGMLASIREGLKATKAKSGRSMKVFGKRKPTKDKDVKAALQDTQEALEEADEERNVLKRQLARMTKKFDKTKGNKEMPAAAAASPLKAAALAGIGTESAATHAGSDAHSEDLHRSIEDTEAELVALKDENSMLMEHLVITKVRLAEVEGDVLESRRALLRSREKQMQLARQIMELQAAEEHGTPVQSPAPSQGTETASPAPADSASKENDRRRSLRLPGLG